MSDLEKKVDDMSGMLHEMRPVLIDIRDGQKSFDVRMRAVEGTGIAHAVKIDRAQVDIDALGRKLRNYAGAAPSPRGEAGGGKWLAFLEVLAVLPQYWHVVLSVGMATLTVLTVVWKHH